MRQEMNQMYQETNIYNTWRVDNQPTAAAGIQLPAGAGAKNILWAPGACAGR